MQLTLRPVPNMWAVLKISPALFWIETTVLIQNFKYGNAVGLVTPGEGKDGHLDVRSHEAKNCLEELSGLVFSYTYHLTINFLFYTWGRSWKHWTHLCFCWRWVLRRHLQQFGLLLWCFWNLYLEFLDWKFQASYPLHFTWADVLEETWASYYRYAEVLNKPTSLLFL